MTLDKWDGNAVKNALNDAIKNVIIFYNSYARPKFILCNKRRPYFFIVYDVLGRKVGLNFSISCQDHVVIYIRSHLFFLFKVFVSTQPKAIILINLLKLWFIA